MKQRSIKMKRIAYFSAVGVILMLSSVIFSACGAVQQSNTYPVEVFTEMHYSPAVRNNEPTRLNPSGADLLVSLGNPESVWNVPDINVRPYDALNARELYRVNCSVCHGVNGLGDGNAATYITASNSYYATTTGTVYEAPPNLQMSRQTLNRETIYLTILNGVTVMPQFRGLLSEEDIREIVEYVFDEQNGLGS